jgi:hypothetical protein
MADSYSRSPKFLKGAIVQFVSMPIIPIPNIIVFQYNPETVTRTLKAFKPADDQQAENKDFDQPFDPEEDVGVSLLLDATDALERPESHPVAFVSGVADRMSALEMLLYPTDGSLFGSLTVDVNVSVGAGGAEASAGAAAALQQPEKPKAPVTLFIWGPGRIVPVRITGMTVEEQAWNQLLYPTRAKVTLQMTVLTSATLQAAVDQGGTAKAGLEIAKFCADFTKGQKQALALANVANTVESILGILPF